MRANLARHRPAILAAPDVLGLAPVAHAWLEDAEIAALRQLEQLIAQPAEPAVGGAVRLTWAGRVWTGTVERIRRDMAEIRIEIMRGRWVRCSIPRSAVRVERRLAFA